MTESEIESVEDEIGPFPEYFRAWLLSLPSKSEVSDETASELWRKFGHIFFTTEMFLQANLVLADSKEWFIETEWSEFEPGDYMAIGGDGCGNYYIVDPDDEESPVHLLSHDPVGIEEGYETVQQYCEAVSRTINGDD